MLGSRQLKLILIFYGAFRFDCYSSLVGFEFNKMVADRRLGNCHFLFNYILITKDIAGIGAYHFFLIHRKAVWRTSFGNFNFILSLVKCRYLLRNSDSKKDHIRLRGGTFNQNHGICCMHNCHGSGESSHRPRFF